MKTRNDDAKYMKYVKVCTRQAQMVKKYVQWRELQILGSKTTFICGDLREQGTILTFSLDRQGNLKLFLLLGLRVIRVHRKGNTVIFGTVFSDPRCAD